MKRTKWLFIAFLFYGTATSAQTNLEDRFTMHGYMDMLLLAGDIQPLGKLAYLNVHRLNLQPQFIISPKFNATVLLEGADLFRLDEPKEEKPGIIEWAYLNYNHSEAFNVRAGLFAIPFGIYNERFYATPTQLTSFLPNSVYFSHDYGDTATTHSEFLFPRSASGLLVSGKLLNLEKHHVSYYAYYANETPTIALAGLGKYVGGRLLYETASSESLKVGVSYNSYWLSNELVNSVAGLDAQLRIKNFQFFTELVVPQIGKRDTLQQPVTGEFHNGISAYAQLGYTIKDIVTPYFRYDYFNGDARIDDDHLAVVVGGVNIAFHPQVIVKMEAYITNYADPDRTDAGLFLGTLAVAF